MIARSVSFWLATSGGTRRRITPAGVAVGRSPESDIVLADERASRNQALVYLAPEGPRVVVLGRGLVEVDSEPVEGSCALEPGARVALPGAVLELIRENEGAPPTRPVWVLEDPDGGIFGINHSPFLVGGGETDDLWIEGWPEGAVRFSTVGAALRVEALCALTIDGETVSLGEARSVRAGSKLTIGADNLSVVTGGAFASGSTARSADPTTADPPECRLEFLARGGRFHFRRFGGAVSMYLPERRCDLLAVLLSPPAPRHAGDFIEDAVVAARVWGKRPVGRVEINVLLHRLRRDLTNGGLDGPGLLERAEGGHATRFAVPADTRVVID